MQRFFRIIWALSLVSLLIVFSLVIAGQFIIPDSVTILEENSKANSKPFKFSCYSFSDEKNENASTNTITTKKNLSSVSLFNIIPVKNTVVVNSNRQYVYPGGEIFGIKLFTEGVIVVDTDTVSTDNGEMDPAKKAGIKIGDIITSVNNVKIESTKKLTSLVEKSNGMPLKVNVISNGSPKVVTVEPLKEKNTGKYKIGIWVRDSMAGIGTVTFYNDNKSFAGLGHGIYDDDTNKIMPMANGEMADAYVKSYYKSGNGYVGELCGVFTGKKNGCLNINCEIGIYGFADKIPAKEKIPVATRQEVHTGDVKIICTIDNNKPKMYTAKITKIFTFPKGTNKDMIIEITDPDLLSKTGGIVQGMSGSPIIQDNMIVGAITHVFVNNPKQGYAVLSEKMYNKSQSSEMVKYEQIMKRAS